MCKNSKYFTISKESDGRGSMSPILDILYHKTKSSRAVKEVYKPQDRFSLVEGGGGVLPYIKLGLYHSGMCHCLGYDF